ncbi:MAG: 1-deoxy-D-xylulose-5-phosphate reductoisomerase, partial [Betaproteobacteria bacterium]|nr:1-deoxy-D-xylulose-5-phosphate reductoisomerase [Betaproteobacteria bacterium]
MKNVLILGATGSVGKNTLDVITRHPDRFRVAGVTAGRRIDDLISICHRHRPDFAVIGPTVDFSAAKSALRAASPRTELLAGEEGLVAAATAPNVDAVMAAIVGSAGLRPTLAAARAGKKVLLANKESLVMSGGLFMQAIAQAGTTLLPIDSEHNAIFQCLPAADGRLSKGVKRILLTGSGGPFRTRSLASLARVTPAEACKHPIWSMGPKISVDSATMMNKALEIIEAHWIFNAGPEQIEVVVHPESVVHSMVEYQDGSVLAQLGNPDMRTPIAHALAYPDRIDAGVAQLDLARIGQLNFEPPDPVRFPALRLAYEVLKASDAAAVTFNAANEIAVQAFLEERLSFVDIVGIVEATLQASQDVTIATV